MLELPRRVLALALCVLVPGLAQARAQHTSSPPTEGEAIEVEVSFALLDLFRVLDAEQALEADVLYRLDWRDVRLAEPGVDQRTFDLDQVWYPDLQPLSPRGVSGLMPDQVTVDEEGNVRLVRRLTGRFGAPTDLHDFPFDSHALGLDFVLTNRLGKVPVRMRQGPIVEVAEA